MRGFTLIELTLSAALAAMIIVAAYACLKAATDTRKTIEPRIEVAQNARVAMALICADLRAACPLATNYDFLGMQRTIGDVEADNLDFGTHNFTPTHANQGDFCQVSYFVEQNPDTGKFGLWRRRNPMIGPDPLSGGSREEIADGLRGVRFEYYDGYDWYDNWGQVKSPAKQTTASETAPNMAGLPAAVRITLWFDPEPNAKTASPTSPTATVPTAPPAATATDETAVPPLVFRSVARLNLADAPQRGTGASGLPDNNSDNSGQNQNQTMPANGGLN